MISQRLVPNTAGGKVVAQEILINNLGIQECILNEKKTGEIPGFIEKGREVSGMQTFDQHLADLVRAEIVDMNTAMQFATNPSDFERNFSFQGSASSSISDEGLSAHANSGYGGITLESDSSTPPSVKPAPGKAGLAPLPSAAAKNTPKSIEITEEGDEPTNPNIPKLPNVA